ncbi:MAG: hypothetical protein U1C46_09950 [Bacteroidales bacterium]|nr:hypothetical protein [Bacteroidales bacterium]
MNKIKNFALVIMTLFMMNDSYSQTNSNSKVSQNKTTQNIARVKAYGDLFFGMPSDSVENILQAQTYSLTIGNYEYIVYCYYHAADLLYKISFTQVMPLSAGFYDTYLKVMHNDLLLTLKNKFGSPTTIYGYPDFLKMDNGYTKLSNVWRQKDKTIELGIGENDFSYFVCLFIYHNKMNSDVIKGIDKQQNQNRQNSGF